MVKKILIVSLFLMFVILRVCSLCLGDLNFAEQDAIKDLLILENEEITEWNVESLEGFEYVLVFESDDYVVIEINGKYLIYYK
ncbi:hypothetical protein ACFLYJ_01410 [Candidatus Cloacimonadota bacterium]